MLFDSETGAAAGRAGTAFQPEFLGQARKLAQAGMTDREMAQFFEVTLRTFYKWKVAHPQFGRATRIGKKAADDRVARSLYQRATGFHYTEQCAFKIKAGPDSERIEVVAIERYMPGETGACLQWLKLRRPDEWREKEPSAPALRDGGEILAFGTIESLCDYSRQLDDAC